MKKHIKILIILICLFLSNFSYHTALAAEDDIKVMLDGNYIDFDIYPQIINGRTLVPMRTIFEELGAQVLWDDTTQTVTALSENNIIKCTINKKEILLNDNKIQMDVAPCIISEKTFVPARFIAESMNCRVEWNGTERTVLIFQKNKKEADDFNIVRNILIESIDWEISYLEHCNKYLATVSQQLTNKNYNSSYCYYDFTAGNIKLFYPNYKNENIDINSIYENYRQIVTKLDIIDISNLSPNTLNMVNEMKKHISAYNERLDKFNYELTLDVFLQIVNETDVENYVETVGKFAYLEAERLNLDSSMSLLNLFK